MTHAPLCVSNLFLRITCTLSLACVPVNLAGTTIVVFRTNQRIVVATDSAAVRLDGTGRNHVIAGCKLGQARTGGGGSWYFLNGGFFRPDAIAKRIAGTATIEAALAALDDGTLRENVVANRGLWPRGQAGSPLMTVAIADSTMRLGVFVSSLKATAPFRGDDR